MRFTKIMIKNFRQYRDLTLNFDKTTEHDIHIVLATNGVGKTNILNAISWCLYNKEYHLNDASKALKILNLFSEKKAAEEGEENCTVSVEIHAEDNNLPIIFHREVVYRVETGFEFETNFTIHSTQTSGNSIHYIGDDAKSFVNRYLPEKIREYIFFDGEKLAIYFFENQATKIKDSVHAISQVDMITLIKERLNTIIRNMEREASKLNPNINTIVGQRDMLIKVIEEKKKEIVDLSEQIQISKNKIENNNLSLQGQEDIPQKEQDYHNLQKKLEQLKKDKIAAGSELVEFIKKYTILLGFYPSIIKTLDIIQEVSDNNTDQEFYDKEMLLQMIRESKCLYCKKDLNTEEKQNIENTLSKLIYSNKTYIKLASIKSELERYKKKASHYLIDREKVLQQNKDIEKDIKKCEEKLSKLDIELRKNTNTDQIRLWYEERNNHKELLDKNNQRLGMFKKDLENKEKDLDKIEEDLTKAMSKEKALENMNKQIDLAKKTLEVAKTIEYEMTEEVRTKIEQETKVFFDKLIWKKNTYKNVILSDNYVLDLIHVNGDSCVGSTSAAERSLLALSFTLALHKVSNFNSLLFIDTPVARVDGENRRNFANVLNAVGKEKQIILTFNPDEYSKTISDVLAPSLSSFVKLGSIDEAYTVITEE